MTIPRTSTLLLRPQDVPPSRDDFEVVGVFNPGAVRVGDEVVLLVRVAERPREQRPGYVGLPRWELGRGLTVDWCSEAEWELVDPRVVRNRSDGLVRLTFISHLQVVRCGDGRSVQEITEVVFGPDSAVEVFGVEDPRITPLEGRYWVTYVAVSRHGPATALASTTDFRTFQRHGVAFCPENKDVVLFPERIAGSFAALHRPVCGTPFTRPEIWVARSPDLLHWGAHVPLVIADGEGGGDGDWRSGRVGAGTPPIRVPGGWLELYHGNQRPTQLGAVGAYYASALLLDPDDPATVRRRFPGPFFVPEADFERNGFIADVVFPTGVVRDEGKGTLLVYYGAADAFTAVAEFSELDVLNALVGLDVT